ncbi:MAG TPA: hypothetical protein V6D12_03055, partial [Candidatus Obscuribacterales bacterium]
MALHHVLCAFTWHLQGRDFHPHGHSVVKVLFGIAPYLSLLAVPKYYYLFRLNESHANAVNVIFLNPETHYITDK